ncbi:hypothetical protein H2200_000291 [Cladophialophora chaetospira]|uniref:Heterokaryon incompatibility domain-containing protein n=1 Tax=Cladophialophora chaetospira TaxID=386627 RepID=A0AA39CQ70_9EURO|nr:hypothetical protein H2200_000291 [Cladophialophora chaetospira]
MWLTEWLIENASIDVTVKRVGLSRTSVFGERRKGDKLTERSLTKLDTASSYEYEDEINGKTHDIRLLVLEPGILPICCSFLKASLADHPDYEALSYTWGEPGGEMPVLLEEKRFLVRKNLYQFLYTICDNATATRVLWIDAICINQENIIERNHSVAHMGKIYASATRVLCWLGPQWRGTDAFFQAAVSARSVGRDFDVSPLTQTEKAGLGSLQECKYWGRQWILQELILAKDVQVLCGQKSASWQDFVALVVRHPFNATAAVNPYMLLYDGHLAQTFRRKRLLQLCAERESGRSLTLVELLARYGDSECRELHDKVYALLGIATDCQVTQFVRVDYRLSLSELLFDVFSVYKGGNLGPLSYMVALQLGLRDQLFRFFGTSDAGPGTPTYDDIPVDFKRSLTDTSILVDATCVATVTALELMELPTRTRNPLRCHACRLRQQHKVSRSHFFWSWFDVVPGDLIFKIPQRHLVFILRRIRSSWSLFGVGVINSWESRRTVTAIPQRLRTMDEDHVSLVSVEDAAPPTAISCCISMTFMWYLMSCGCMDEDESASEIPGGCPCLLCGGESESMISL